MRKLNNWFYIISAILALLAASACKPDPDDGDSPVPFTRLVENQFIQSKILARKINYAVLLPEGYQKGTGKYPVVYLLHGYGDSEKAWYQGGNIKYYADLYESETGPVIFVMPDGFNTYWVNKYNGNYPYMDMLIGELVPEVDSLYRTSADPSQRAVMGYSMGGYGALVLTAMNPAVFGTAVVLSMSFRTDQQYLAEPQGNFDSQWGSIFGGIGKTGEERLTPYFKEYSPFYFFADPGNPSLSGQRYFIDCGDDEESLSQTNGSLHIRMRDLGVGHEFRMRNGAHTWDYWHGALPEAFRYLGFAFRNSGYPQESATVETGAGIPSERFVNLLVPGSTMPVSVVIPGTYNAETASYPVICLLHDTTAADDQVTQEKLLQLMNRNMDAARLQKSLLVEIRCGDAPLTEKGITEIIQTVKENFRTATDGKHAVLICNHKAGANMFNLLNVAGPHFNALLFFEAALPDDASIINPDFNCYLDVCDQSPSYRGNHSLFMSFRDQQGGCETRVRQGNGSYGDFLAGLDAASVFIKDNLKY